MDGNGNIILLRGANFVGYGMGNWQAHTFEDYWLMKSWGFNLVRLPISWNLIEPEHGFFDQSYLAIIQRDIEWAKQLGFYVVLDMHHWKWSPYFTYAGGNRNGMPIWLVNGYDNSEEGMNEAISDFWLGKAPNGTEATPGNPSMQDRYIEVWKHLAKRFADESAIGAYDLFNEPPQGSVLTASEVTSYLYPFYERLISEIRKLDDNHILIYENLAGCTTRTARPLNYSNVIFSFHFYRDSSLANKSYSGNILELENEFVERYWNLPERNPIKNWNLPIWIGEFGSSEELWVRDTVKILGSYSLGWAWWAYYKSDSMPYALLFSNGTERTYLTQYLKRISVGN